MPQIENTRLHSWSDIPDECHDGLRLWLTESSTGSFPIAELELHRSVALAYADPRRPSIRTLYKGLCEMLARDEHLTGTVVKRPSLEAFRHLVLTLPPAFVDHMRYGQQISTWEIIKTAEHTSATVASTTASVH
ncbi:hypothetical protein ELH66_08110 [Rhizobium ruizarguesonis]|uniref:hypothetical protein n=1 Tax=Rhizobium ruizarguesonis TaxID=2081791 RepID=UPI0010301962|nr:hypothetical protein [Rhizobium ruizarguesonis]TBA20963.1 hypothetical protein ELH66_08110 [Rhizobium ruizarguesonis]